MQRAAHVAAWLAYDPRGRVPKLEEFQCLSHFLDKFKGWLLPSHLGEVLPDVLTVLKSVSPKSVNEAWEQAREELQKSLLEFLSSCEQVDQSCDADVVSEEAVLVPNKRSSEIRNHVNPGLGRVLTIRKFNALSDMFLWASKRRWWMPKPNKQARYALNWTKTNWTRTSLHLPTHFNRITSCSASSWINVRILCIFRVWIANRLESVRRSLFLPMPFPDNEPLQAPSYQILPHGIVALYGDCPKLLSIRGPIFGFLL